MTMAIQTTTIDEQQLEAFIGLAANKAGPALNAALVALGDELGLYKAMADGQPVDPATLAARTGTHERYVLEWLNVQAASGFVHYDPETKTYILPPEHALVLADDSTPAAMGGNFQSVRAAVAATDQLIERFKDGEGLGWHEQHQCLWHGTDRSFAVGYNANLVSSWLPALDGVVDKLEAGARVADIGCGHGASTVIMAQAYPNSTFTGTDYHPGSIAKARARAADAGLTGRVRFETSMAAASPGEQYALVTTFDCLHDMGDPVSAARHIRDSLAPNGTWLIVEPMAGDRVEDNLNPVGRAYYGFSTFLCTPASLTQPPALALGAQAGEQRIADVVSAAGFTRF